MEEWTHLGLGGFIAVVLMREVFGFLNRRESKAQNHSEMTEVLIELRNHTTLLKELQQCQRQMNERMFEVLTLQRSHE